MARITAGWQSQPLAAIGYLIVSELSQRHQCSPKPPNTSPDASPLSHNNFPQLVLI